MLKIEKAVLNSGNYAFEMKFMKGFPIEFFTGKTPFCTGKSTLMSDIIHPDDYMPFCKIVDDVVDEKINEIKAHVRLKAGDDHRWYYISAAAERGVMGSLKFSGMLFDVSEYLESDGEDAVMQNFRSKLKSRILGESDEPNLLEILGKDYLELIQQPFSHIKGLYSAIVSNNGQVIASAYLQDKKANLNKMSYQRKKSIRIKHRPCAEWIIAGESLDEINESAPLLDIMVQTVSEIANSYIVISEEMENSQNANKLLGENFEDQILINNIYSKTMTSKNSSEAFAQIVPVIKEYFTLDDIYFVADDSTPVKIYHWDVSGGVIPQISEYGRSEEVESALDINAVVCIDEDDLKQYKTDKNRSCALARVLEGGKPKGVMVFISTNSARTWSNRDKKVLRSLTSIMSTLINRSMMERELEESREHLSRLAYTDIPTGIPNRSAFVRDFKEAAASEGCAGAIIAIEIANCKAISESFGFHYANDVFRSIAEYIAAIPTHSKKNVYRYTDDIIFVALDGADRGEALGFSKTIMSKFRQPWFLNDDEHRIEMYSGICFYPADADNIEDCVKGVNRTLLLAKERKTHETLCFSNDLEEKLEENIRIRKLLIDSAQNDLKGFYFLFSPVVDIKTGEIVSAEGAMYWTNENVMLSKERFLPIVQRMGLSTKLCGLGMSKYCELCSKIRKSGKESFRIGVEIFQSTLEGDNGAALLKLGFKNNELSPSGIGLIVSHGKGTLLSSSASLKQLAGEGVNIVLDDKDGSFFIESLSDFPFVNIIRINAKRFTGDEVEAEFTRKYIQSAHEGGKLVCVKDVDDAKTLETVKKFDVDLIQGIVNGRPMHTKELLSKLGVS